MNIHYFPHIFIYFLLFPWIIVADVFNASRNHFGGFVFPKQSQFNFVPGGNNKRPPESQMDFPSNGRNNNDWNGENRRRRLECGNWPAGMNGRNQSHRRPFAEIIPNIQPNPRQQTNLPKQIIENSNLPEYLIKKERSQICNWTNPADSICRHFQEFGWPIQDLLIWKEDFFINFNQRTRLAHWVLEQITPQSVRHNENLKRQNMIFHAEQKVNRMFAATEKDYRALYGHQPIQMNHGHLAPALDHWSDENKLFATFSLANIAPQSKILNSGAWNWLEKRARQAVLNGNQRRSASPTLHRFNSGRFPNPSIAAQNYSSNSFFFPDEKNAYICPWACQNAFIYTGPLFLAENNVEKIIKYKVVGEHQMAIPSHFFKAIFIQTPRGIYNENYLLPNKNMDEEYFRQNHNSYKISLEEIGFALMKGNVWQKNGQHLPSTIHEFWEQFGRPIDHQIERRGNTVYSCNGHLNLLNWKLEVMNRENPSNFNIFESNNAKCQPNIDMGRIGKEIDNETSVLMAKTGADIFLYSGPLFPADKEGYVKYKLERNGHFGGKIATPESFFKIRLSKMPLEKIQIDSFIFPKIAKGALNDYKTTLEEVERISGIQLIPNKIEQFLNGNLENKNNQNIAASNNRRTWRRLERNDGNGWANLGR